MSPIRIDTDLEFLDASRSERLDLYRPAEALLPLPVVIFLHGGAFHRGDKASERSQILCRLLAESGVAALSVNYRLSPGAEGDERWEAWPTNLMDASAALSFVDDHAERLGLDPTRIAVAGTSAGATLALLMAFGAADSIAGDPIAARIGTVVNFYGRVDWTRHTVPEKVPSSADIAREASPLTWINTEGRTPAVLTFHGDADEVVPVEHARMLDEALARCGSSHELVIFPGAPHAFALEPAPQTIRERLTGFLATQLQPNAAPARSEP